MSLPQSYSGVIRDWKYCDARSQDTLRHQLNCWDTERLWNDYRIDENHSRETITLVPILVRLEIRPVRLHLDLVVPAKVLLIAL